MRTTMISLTRKIMIIASMLMLASCSLLSPVKSEPQSSYILNCVPTNMARHKTHAITLLVMQPDINQAYNTTDMAYSVRPFQIAYFSQNHWAEKPDEMLQPLLVQTLQNTHFFHAVVTPPYTGQYDYVLNTRILQLQQDFTHRIPMLQLTVNVQLSNMITNRVIATKQFCISEPIMQRTPYSGVIAANCAMSKMLAQIAEFTLRKIN